MPNIDRDDENATRYEMTDTKPNLDEQISHERDAFELHVLERMEKGEQEMKIEIKCRFTGNVLFTHEAEGNTIKLTVEAAAVSARAYLSGANLVGADLSGEKLTKAPLSLLNLRWHVLITGQYMRIGCKRHTHEEWAAMDDAAINQMDTGALKFWRKWKTPLLALCDGHKD